MSVKLWRLHKYALFMSSKLSGIVCCITSRLSRCCAAKVVALWWNARSWTGSASTARHGGRAAHNTISYAFRTALLTCSLFHNSKLLSCRGAGMQSFMLCKQKAVHRTFWAGCYRKKNGAKKWRLSNGTMHGKGETILSLAFETGTIVYKRFMYRE